MPKKTPTNDKLDMYSQRIIDDLFDMSDEDLMLETSGEWGNVEEIVNFTKTIFENAKSNIGKSRLNDARNKINQKATRPTSHSNTVVNIENARRLLNSIKDDNNSLSQKITLAARNLDTLSDEEILSLYSDLMDLGFSDDGNFK